MHSLYFVFLEGEEAETPLDIMHRAENLLLQEGFCGEGFFNQAKADWFSIGGRWSGILKMLELVPIDALEEEYITYDENKQREIWRENNVPTRFYMDRSFEEYEDDAVIVNKEMIKKLKKIYGSTEAFDFVSRQEMTIGNFDMEKLIKKWIIVIDYHH